MQQPSVGVTAANDLGCHSKVDAVAVPAVRLALEVQHGMSSCCAGQRIRETEDGNRAAKRALLGDLDPTCSALFARCAFDVMILSLGFAAADIGFAAAATAPPVAPAAATIPADPDI